MKNKQWYLLCIISTILILSCTFNDKNEIKLKPTNLLCNYLTNPLSLNNLSPFLGWQFSSKNLIQIQRSYHILVSSSKEKIDNNIADLWDSGKIESDQSQHVKYVGNELKPRQQVFWKVKVWDQNDQPSEWSDISKWEIGLLDKHNWTASWIGISEDKNPENSKTNPAPYFRKEFSTDKNVKSANVYISGLGYYELHINGEKVGDYVLAPAPTNYSNRKMKKLLYNYIDRSKTRVLYNTFDISRKIKNGINTIGIILGNGWFNQRDRQEEGSMWYDTPRLIMQLEIEYEDGTNEKVISDDTWKVSTGAILHDGIFTGEIYDSRLDPSGWNKQGYDDSKWQNAKIVNGPTGKLQAQLAPSDKVIRNIKPILKKENGNGNYLYDFGEMFSGWVKIKVKGKKGTKVSLRYIEEMGGDYGQKDLFILKGNGIEEYEPRFTWHAFRQVEIEGISDSTDLISLVGRVVNTDVDTVGFFESSNELFNKIYESYVRTQLGNYHGSFSSDCPHRERLGYTGDGQLLVESSIFSFDMTQFYQKWINDMADAQDSITGFVPHTAPFGGGGGGPAWGSSYVVVPWFYYLYYGDKSILRDHYSGMKKWVEYLRTRTDQNGLVVKEEPGGWCLGDWATPGKVEIPPSFVNTCYYYYVADILSKTADVLGNITERDNYRLLTKKIKKDLNYAYYDKEKKIYWENRQGANAFPLAFGLVPEEDIEKVVDSLVDSIINNKGHFDTGILATPLVLDVLCKFGREDIAFTLMNQRDYPGYGYLLEKNATTLWEYWDGKLSHSHPMYGSVIRWFFKELAGINPDPEKPGFKNIIIKPLISGDLTYVSASYKSIYGKVKSNWQIKDENLHLNVEIPPNTSAKIFIPSIDEKYIKIKKQYEQSKIEFLKIEENYSVYVAGSGIFEFISENIKNNIKQVHASTPIITPYDTLFFTPQIAEINIKSATEGAYIFYTIDGTEPNSSSLKYEEPIKLEKNCIVNAKAFKDGYLPSFVKSTAINFVDLKVNGIEYTVFEGMWDKKPDIENLIPVSSGKTNRFNVNEIKKREDHIAIHFKTFLEIDQEGEYTFYSSANDGSVLYINKKVIVDNAGYSGNKVESGKVKLKKGRHLLEILYFENTGSESLDVFIEGSNLTKQPIPPFKLFYKDSIKINY